MRMSIETAAKILGCSTMPTESELRTAFGKAMLSAHPDTLTITSKYQVAEVKEARDTLQTAIKVGGPPCRLCGGRGTTGAGGFARICSQCDGTGEQRP